MTVQEHIINDMKTAMREKRVEMRDLLRVVMAEFSREGKELTDEEALAVLTKLSKNTKDNITKLTGEDKEKAARELVILELYLPAQMDELELKRVCMNHIMNLTSPTIKDMGKVMSFLKEKHGGLYDGKQASTIVRELLS